VDKRRLQDSDICPVGSQQERSCATDERVARTVADIVSSGRDQRAVRIDNNAGAIAEFEMQV
jgi:hypothetical protein